MARPTNISYGLNATTGKSSSVIPAGGTVIRVLASVTLKVGDVVYWDTTSGYVTSSVTAANYANKIAGVVVGSSRLLNGEIADGDVINTTEIGAGIVAATVNQDVLIQIDGIAYVVTDTATAITIGAIIGPNGPTATTAGRIAANATTGQILGNALDTASAIGTAIRIFLMYR